MHRLIPPLNQPFRNHSLEHFELFYLEALIHCFPSVRPVCHDGPALEGFLLLLDRCQCKLSRRGSNSDGLAEGVVFHIVDIFVFLQSFELDWQAVAVLTRGVSYLGAF